MWQQHMACRHSCHCLFPSAPLCLPPSFPPSCADVVIGSRQVGRHAMHNEQRRLAIGVQMIMNPPLLLLDEPTSG